MKPTPTTAFVLIAVSIVVFAYGVAEAQTITCTPYGGTVTCIAASGPGNYTWTVPARVTSAAFDVKGAQGGRPLNTVVS